MARGEPGVEHLLRRAGFGASQDDLNAFEGFSTSGVLQWLLDYEQQPDDVDSKIGDPAYASINASGGFSPNLNIEHARQRWLFRMVHSRRPLQEKMALFWHNHFATAYSKIAGAVGGRAGHAHDGAHARASFRARPVRSRCSDRWRSAASAIC